MITHRPKICSFRPYPSDDSTSQGGGGSAAEPKGASTLPRTGGLAALTSNFRGHSDLGSAMGLFAQFEFAPGTPILLPRGEKLYNILQTRMRTLLENNGYEYVRAAVLVRQSLLKISGHMEKYAESMFHWNDRDYGGLALKPMNCPEHMNIFAMKPRSYRELPIRYHDESTLHRKESSGTLNCMARLQGFHQDDTHIFVAPDQVGDELKRLLGLVDRIYKGVGMDYAVRLSTRPEKYLGEISVWDQAESALKANLSKLGINYTVDEGGGAFYGPKIDIDVNAANGKPWQLATSQLDFQLPERFELEYVAADGSRKRPIVIHSALFGAYERFIALLLENTQGNLPAWLCPEQVRVLPVKDAHLDGAKRIVEHFRTNNIRANLDAGGTLGARIRDAQPYKVPFIVVVGDREISEATLSVRRRGENAACSMKAEDFVRELTDINRFEF